MISILGLAAVMVSVEQFWVEEIGGLVPGKGGGVIEDWHPLGGNELVGDLLGTDVKIDPIGLLIISILCPD